MISKIRGYSFYKPIEEFFHNVYTKSDAKELALITGFLKTEDSSIISNIVINVLYFKL